MDALAQLDVVIPELQKLALGTNIDQLDAPTPCEKWAVRDVFGHFIGVATVFAALLRGDEPPPVPQPRDDALAATASSALADADGGFRSPGALERVLQTPFGELTGEVFARLTAFDLLMHTWDLSQATSQPFSVPDDVVAEIDSFARQALKPEMRGPGTFDAETEPATDATTLTRLVAFSGRRT